METLAAMATAGIINNFFPPRGKSQSRALWQHQEGREVIPKLELVFGLNLDSQFEEIR